jgi:hypothetical protein
MSAALVGGALDTLQIQEMSSNLLADGSASGTEAVIIQYSVSTSYGTLLFIMGTIGALQGPLRALGDPSKPRNGNKMTHNEHEFMITFVELSLLNEMT